MWSRGALKPLKRRDNASQGMGISTVITPEDIEAEHNAALASLTFEQRRALDRMASARQRTNFNGRLPRDNLRAIFEAEATARLVLQVA